MICSWLNAIVDLVAQHPGWSLFLAFAGSVIEAVAVIAILIPGTPLLMAVTAAAALAGQPMLPYLIVAIVGAVIGDFTSYWAGDRYRTRLRGMWPFSRKPEMMAQADGFFHRWGLASVALCRFVPILRSTVPLVAGMAGMKRRRFVLANVASAFVWAPVHVYPAQLAGLSLGRLQDGDWQTASIWAAALLGCAAAGWVLHRQITLRVR